MVDPALVEEIVAKRPNAQTSWAVSTEAELYNRLQTLTRTLMKKSDAIQMEKHGMGLADTFKWTRKVDRLLQQLEVTLERHPKWKLKLLRDQIGRSEGWIICLALVGKELGHLNGDESLFTGGGLARAACDKAAETARTMYLEFTQC